MKLTEKQKELLQEVQVISLSTVSPSGKPHSIAVAYPKVVSEDKVIITDNFMEETVENLKNNKSVSLLFWSTEWEDIDNCYGYELRGKCDYYDSGKWKKFVDNLDKNEELPAKGALVIKVEEIKELT